MACYKTLYSKDNTKVTLEDANNRNRGKFRHLARKVSGEVYDIPENNEVLFVYEKQFLVGELCFSKADFSLNDPGYIFDSDYYPQITFMFVHQDFQQYGYGRLLVTSALGVINSQSQSRPIRLQSASDAVGFFQRCGFQVVGEPMQCFPGGSRLFRCLVNMEYAVT